VETLARHGKFSKRKKLYLEKETVATDLNFCYRWELRIDVGTQVTDGNSSCKRKLLEMENFS
jgi:hypothetical protein